MSKEIISVSHFSDIEKSLMGGFPKGKITIISARTGMGKTWLAILIFHKLLKKNRPSVFVSLDLSIGSIWRRLTMIESGLSMLEYDRNLQAGKGTEKWDRAAEKLSAFNPRIVNVPRNTSSISAELENEINKSPNSVILLDGLIYIGRTEAKRFIDSELENIKKLLPIKGVSLVIFMGLGRGYSDAKGIVNNKKVAEKIPSKCIDKIIVIQNDIQQLIGSPEKFDRLEL